MKVTRNINGAIQVNGKSIDMYLLAYWVIAYNDRTGTRLRAELSYRRALTDVHRRST